MKSESPKIAAELLPWFRDRARDLPWRRTRDPYAIWISEIMLQQTQVKTVIPYWERWMAHLPDVASLAAAPEEQVLKLWEGLGYYSRARNLQRAARLIVGDHAGRFPETVEGLLALPGIGPYTAGAIASIAFNLPAPILDGNVIRVLTRLHALRGDPRTGSLNAHLWSLATDLVTAAAALPRRTGVPRHSAGTCSALNQSLMELGATVCLPRDPDCAGCPLSPHCRAHREDRVQEYPTPQVRSAPVTVRKVVAVVECSGKVLLRQRPAGGVNAGFWEFPEQELAGDTAAADALALWFPAFRGTPVALKPVRHSITRYRIRLDVYRLRTDHMAIPSGTGARWVSATDLASLPLTAAHRKIARQVTG